MRSDGLTGFTGQAGDRRYFAEITVIVPEEFATCALTKPVPWLKTSKPSAVLFADTHSFKFKNRRVSEAGSR
jgi:hypothetical protein